MIRRAALAGLTMALAWPVAAFAQTGWGIGVQHNGAIVFCDRERSTVWRIEAGGHRSAVLSGVTCRAVITAPDGSVDGETTPSDFTATRGVGLWQVDAAGAVRWLMPPTLTPAPDEGLVRDALGRMYSWTGKGAGSARSEIQRRDVTGTTMVVAGAEWGQRDGIGLSALFGNIAGFALAPDGSIVVADSGNIRRVSRLQVVETEARGVVTDSRAGLVGISGLWGRELGVATDVTGAGVVVDPEAGRIVRVDRSGRVTPIWEPAGFAQRVSGGRWGWRPAGVAMMGRTYYVLDEWMGPALIADLIGSPRLSQVDSDGRVTRIASAPDWTVRCATGALGLIAASLIWAGRRQGQRAEGRGQRRG